jgi:hypothetical protein
MILWGHLIQVPTGYELDMTGRECLRGKKGLIWNLTDIFGSL